METPSPWQNKVANHAQMGGIETSVLDNGAGKGTRIAWINTGTGLRYKVVLDRAMDIADAFFNKHSLTWLNRAGVTPPQAFAYKGIDWLKTWGGGLVTTCGLTHIGGPEKDEFGERGLHDVITNMPAEIESVIQPDPATGKLQMSITGIIRQMQMFGPNLELRRTISGTLGQPSIRIHDEVINRGNLTAPHMLLYHCNFGWPLVDEGTQLLWQGAWQQREGNVGKIINETNNFKVCPPPDTNHNGTGEEAAIIDIAADDNGTCICGLYNQKIGLAVALKFTKNQLPWLTNWQHWGFGEYVTGLEPGTHPPIGQAKARAEKTLLFIEPGQSKTYDLEIEVLHEAEPIKTFLQILTKAN